jgi:hypothetical protein
MQIRVSDGRRPQVLLLAQYLLGMVVNVYVVLPGRHPGAGAGDYFTGAVSGLAWVISDGPGWAAAHAAFGLALAVAALASIALARGRTAGWRWSCRCSARWPSSGPGSTGPASWITGTRSAR